MTEDKKDRRKEKIQKILKRAAPVIISVSSAMTWFPVYTSSAEALRSQNTDNTEAHADKPLSYHDDKTKLALAESGSANAYSQSIGQISIETETGDLPNPPAAATGNGYYGQHQFGNSSVNDFCVRKYIAFALVNGSPEFKKSLCDNLLNGGLKLKESLIDKFAASLEKYDSKQQYEKAYFSSNPAYKNLFSIMNVTPATFTKAHENKDFADEAQRLQSRFVYEVYLQQMSISLKSTIAQNPQIKFESIHPAVMSSVLAIAIKKGNGGRFKSEMEKATIAAYQQQALKKWEADTSVQKNGKKPLVIACRTGDLDAENIAVIGKNIRIYDGGNSGLKPKDILTTAGYKVSVIKGTKPKSISTPADIVTFNMQKDKIDIAPIVNNEEWLKNYCGTYKTVFNKAVKQLDKVPTLETYYEMSLILNQPGLYKMAQDYYQQNKPSSTLAFNDTLQRKLMRDKYQNS